MGRKTAVAVTTALIVCPIIVLVGYKRWIDTRSHSLDWEGLGDALKGQLKLRAQWIVYVDGDSNLPWQDVAQAADIAKGLHAKVVLLTPETRKLVEPEFARVKPARR